MPEVSIIILTHNEEQNLGPCLDSLSGFDDIHILDSGSSDRTRDLARERKVDVHENPFSGFGTQRNWAIDHIPHQYEWVFHLDADERMTPALAAELELVTRSKPEQGGFFVASKTIFAGKWLRRAAQYPAYQLRFFHRRRLRFVDHGHGQREVTEASVGKLKEPLLHLAFSKGLDHWFAKHAVYARHEAELAMMKSGGSGSLFSTDPVLRRRALKRLSQRMPMRYFLRLCYMLFVQGAIFDGRPGIIYSQMLATYEAMMDIHLKLLRNRLIP